LIHEAGPVDGKLVIFLHGFPEIALTSWKHQISYFAQKGYYVVAPDLRGFGRSKVTNPKYADAILAAYDISWLILRVYKKEKAFIVGHDFGGAVAWWHSFLFPQQVEKLVLVNMPHLAVFRKSLMRSCSQIRKSWYLFLFQVPYCAEYKLQVDDYSALVHALPPNAFTKEDINLLKASWKGTLPYNLGYYRNLFGKPSFNQLEQTFKEKRPEKQFHVAHPVLIIFGKQDKEIGWELAEPSVRNFCKNGRVIFYENSSHWVTHMEPDRLNTDVDNFFTRS